MPIPLIKTSIMRKITRGRYFFGIDDSTDAPVILKTQKNSRLLKLSDNSESSCILDNDIIMYYSDNYFDFIAKFLDPETIETFKVKKEQSDSTVISNKKDFNYLIDVPKLYSEITSYVIGQDEPIKKILTAIWKHYNGYSNESSRNILINGSTGVGKTEIFRVLTEIINIPCYTTSATSYSATGYRGRDVEDMLVSLLAKANGDIEEAQNGILIIDEIDKLSQSDNISSVNQRDVQEGLLKLVEGGTFYIEWKDQVYTFDTSKLLVIAMGSWSRIKFKEKVTIGFERPQEEKKYKKLTPKDMTENGMIPEFIGRFPVLVSMNELTFDNYLNILKNGKRSALLLNQKLLESQNILLTISDDALRLIASKATNSEFGARSLDEIVENALSKAIFEIAFNPKEYSELEITTETISNNCKYNLKKRVNAPSQNKVKKYTLKK